MKNWTVFVLVLLTFFSCKKDRGTTWDAEYLTPLATGELSIANLLKDSTIQENSDKSLNLVLDKTIYELEPTNIDVPDTVITSSFTLQSLIISDRIITQKVTLGQINPAFAFLNGTYQDIPSQNIQDAAEVPIDASEFFTTATVKTGFLDMTITNELPVNVAKVVMELYNESDKSVVVTETFTNIPAFGSSTRSVPLDGKTINAALIGSIKELVTDASNGKVLIDVTKGVEMKLGIRDLKAQSAIAAFPTQNIMEQDEGLVLEMGDAELKKIKVKTGQMKIDFFTSVRENMTIYFKVPSLTYNGVAIEETIKVSGASPGSPVTATRTYDLAGYWMDYRGKNPEITDTVNTFHQILYVRLDSSGRKLPMSLDDSVYMYYGITDIVPEYALGYFGSTENPTGDASTVFEEFKVLNGEVELEDATVKLKVTNALGAGGVLDINSIKSYNSNTQKEVILNSTVIPDRVNIVPARAEPLRPWVTEYVLDKSNSNIVDFIGNLPDELGYNVNLKINPNGNTSNYTDFLYSNSVTKVSMEVEIPLRFSTTGLTLNDTVDFNYPEEKQADYVKSANLFLHLENGFPFDVEPRIIMLNDNGVELGVLLDGGESVASGAVDGATGEVISSNNSSITIAVPKDKLELLKATKQVVLQAKIKSPDNVTEKTTLRSNYFIKMKLISDFVYEMGL